MVGTRAPTEMLKFTLVVSWIFSDLMAETIWVRFSAGGAAVAEVAALPVVVRLAVRVGGRALGLCVVGLRALAVGRSCCRGPRPSCPCRPWPRRSPSSCSSTSTLRPVAVLRALAAPGAFSRTARPSCRTRSPSCPDSAPFMPDVPPLSRCIAPPTRQPRSEDGALCWPRNRRTPRRVPVPCAFAKPVPAISAAAATEIKKRLVIECLLTCLHCPRRQRKEMR